MPKKNSRGRGGESTEESLRGKNRELQKKIRQLEQKVKWLEKQLGLKSTIPEEKVEEIKREPKKIICDYCGKGEMKPLKVSKLDGELWFLVCEIETCKHKKRIK